MERCESRVNVCKEDLLHSMMILHSFQIVHCDIKPDNIMWSPAYRKFVFIDFGLSYCESQRPGFLSHTCYIGTYNFCCPDMQRLCISRSTGLVDIYFNDYYCLAQSIKATCSTFSIKN